MSLRKVNHTISEALLESENSAQLIHLPQLIYSSFIYWKRHLNPNPHSWLTKTIFFF
jgi:hypothetical protein